MSIANSDGLVIQELDRYLASKNGIDDMKEVFDRARRHALDTNGAFDDLIHELDEFSDQIGARELPAAAVRSQLEVLLRPITIQILSAFLLN